MAGDARIYLVRTFPDPSETQQWLRINPGFETALVFGLNVNGKGDLTMGNPPITILEDGIIVDNTIKWWDELPNLKDNSTIQSIYITLGGAGGMPMRTFPNIAAISDDSQRFSKLKANFIKL